MTSIALRYDLRSPDWAATKHPDLYAACLEQCAWADDHQIATIISLSEHHGMQDGYMSSPLSMAAAVAARTKRTPVTIAAALVPLHDPVRFAEQFATVDLIARGRVSVVAGLGYAYDEFTMAGVDRTKRGAICEEHVEVMLKAWTGEPFEWRGRTIRVTPKPYSQPHPPLFIGGSTEKAARRAARLKLWFFPAFNDPALQDAYLQESQRVGFDSPFCVMPNGPGFVHVTEDPDKAWAEIERYAWYDAQSYAAMQTPGQRSAVTSKASSPDQLRAEGIYWVVTPDECVERAKALGPMGAIVLHPLLAGMPADLGWSSLELFKDAVLPRL